MTDRTLPPIPKARTTTVYNRPRPQSGDSRFEPAATGTTPLPTCSPTLCTCATGRCAKTVKRPSISPLSWSARQHYAAETAAQGGAS
jgi:hypothetical protein